MDSTYLPCFLQRPNSCNKCGLGIDSLSEMSRHRRQCQGAGDRGEGGGGGGDHLEDGASYDGSEAASESGDRRDESLVIFPKKKIKGNLSYSNEHIGTVRGTIVKVIPEKRIGFIKTDTENLSGPCDYKNIFFHLNNVENKTAQKIELSAGSQVHFVLDKNPKDVSKPAARLVFVDRSSILTSKQRKEDIRIGWWDGTIVDAQEKYYFIRPSRPLPGAYNQNKDVYAKADLIPKILPKPRTGYILKFNFIRLKNCHFISFYSDTVQFFPGSRNPDKPEARSLIVLQYKGRAGEEIEDILSEATAQVKDEIANAAGFSKSKAFWDLLFSERNTGSISHQLMFLHLVLTSLEQLGLDNQLKDMVEIIKNVELFSEDGSLSNVVKTNLDHLDQIMELLFIISKVSPQFLMGAQTFMEEIKKVIRNDEMYVLIPWLIKFLKLSLSLNNSSDGKFDWCKKAVVPSADEMLGTPLENDSNLHPVRRDSAYSSSEEYMDTNFRLLRTESFASIQQGIQNLLSGELDERDMNVYYNIKVVGYRSTSRSLNIGVSFNTIKPIRY